jgi:hypothetical protein
LHIDRRRNKAVFVTQTTDSKQPSMGSVFGAENYIFWQPMTARISISLGQFYGTFLAGIYNKVLCSLWQFYYTDHKCNI